MTTVAQQNTSDVPKDLKLAKLFQVVISSSIRLKQLIRVPFVESSIYEFGYGRCVVEHGVEYENVHVASRLTLNTDNGHRMTYPSQMSRFKRKTGSSLTCVLKVDGR